MRSNGALGNVTVLVLFVVLSLLVAGAHEAEAACATPRLLETNGAYLVSNPDWHGAGGDRTCTYVWGCYASESDPPIGSDLLGVFWSMGAGDPAIGAGDDNGDWDSSNWTKQFSYQFHDLYHYAAFMTLPGGSPGVPGLRPNWALAGDGCVTPGPDGTECTAVLLTDQWNNVGLFSVLTARADTVGNFPLSPTTTDAGGALSIILREIPRPASVRAGYEPSSDLVLEVEVPEPLEGIDQDPACAAVLRGFRVWVFPTASGAAPPQDRNIASGWTLPDLLDGNPQGVAPFGSPLEVRVSSALTDGDLYVATQLVFDSEFATPVLSANASLEFVDSDLDGLTDDEELQLGTNPNDPDTDDDGLLDGFEVSYGFDPFIPGEETDDPDADGLHNLDEQAAGTDPHDPDTDGDGLSDPEEWISLGTDPVNADTDADGLDDGLEVLVHGTDPLDPDTDGGGIPDGEEVNVDGTDPLDSSDDLNPIDLPTVLIDGRSFVWDIQGNGRILDGSNDAFDGGLTVRFGGRTFSSFSMAEVEDAGREIWIGSQEIDQSIQVSRKIFVPEDEAFVRYLEILENPTGDPVSTTVRIETNLGSNSNTQIVQTSNGDLVLTFDDDWVVTDDWDGYGDPTVVHVFSSPDADIEPSSVSAQQGSDIVTFSFIVTVPAGGQSIIMHLASQNPTQVVATESAQNLVAGMGRVFDGLSVSETRNILNFDAGPDTDGDGLNDDDELVVGTDPHNPDTDGDGLLDGFEVDNGFDPLSPGEQTDDTDGDGLDNLQEQLLGTDPNRADTDEDGLTDGLEIELGTNPLTADSDGDGVLDGADNCPMTANPNQIDDVHPDGVGDACDDPDFDGVSDLGDNCPDTPNAEQANVDGDALGDSCDPYPDNVLRVRLDSPRFVLAGASAPITFRLESPDGTLLPSLVGVRGTLTLDGAAVFGTFAANGLLLQGGGTNRALVEFVDGLVTLEIRDTTPEIVNFGIEDTSGIDIAMTGDLFLDFEASDGGFVELQFVGIGGPTELVEAEAPSERAVEFEWSPDPASGGLPGSTESLWEWGIPTSGPGFAFSGERVWATNLDGNYPNGANAGLVSPAFSVPVGAPAFLEYRSWFDGDSWNDHGAVYLSFEGQSNWWLIDSFTESTEDYLLRSYNVSAYAGQDIRAQFRFTSNYSVTRAGWYIDDVRLRGGTPTVEFLDPAGDADEDGLSNAEELASGADPSNPDSDGDGVIDGLDNCPVTSNPDQSDDVHPDGIGDACDDPDEDGVADIDDNCPDTSNPGQQDTTHPNGIGDVCDDPDGDAEFDDTDNCPDVPNAEQADFDGDGVGNACDVCPETPNPEQPESIACIEITEDGGACLETWIDMHPNVASGHVLVLGTEVLESIAFDVLATSCGSSDTIEFYLNGSSLGTLELDPALSCGCLPGIQQFVVDDGQVLHAAWNARGDNTLGVSKNDSASALAWVTARIDFVSRSETTCLHDHGGGDCDEVNLCAAGSSFDPISAESEVVDPFADLPVVATEFVDSELPSLIEIDSLANGAAEVCVTEELDPGRFQSGFGIIADGVTHTAIVFDTTTNSILGKMDLDYSDSEAADCAIAPDGQKGFTTDFDSRLWAIDLSATPPRLAGQPNPIPISNPGEDVSITADGRYVVTCDGVRLSPVSVVDVASQTEISTFDTGSDCDAVEACADGSVLVSSVEANSVKRLTIDESGTLTDTGDSLGVFGPINVYCAPDLQSGILVSRYGSVVSFTLPEMSGVEERPNFNGIWNSAVFSSSGDRVFLRGNYTLDAYEYDSTTATFGTAPLFTIPLPFEGRTYYGVEQVALDPTGSKLYVPQPGGLRIYDAADGTHLSTITDPDLLSASAGICVLPRITGDCVSFTKQGERILAINGAPCGPPVANAGPDMSEECVSPVGNVFLLDGSGSTDPSSTPGSNDDIVLFEWFEDYGLPGERLLGVGQVMEITLPLGDHAVTLRVTDSFGETGTDEMSVNVVDTTVPRVLVDLDPDLLWPPNHRLASVVAATTVLDECSEPLAILTSVSSSEADDDSGASDGSTSDDIQEAETGTADYTFKLRAERSGTGPGRRYTAIYAAMDDSGNIGSVAGYVDVPHDQGGVTDPIGIQINQSSNGLWVSWSPVEGAHHYSVIRGDMSNIVERDSQIELGPVVCVEAYSDDGTTQGFEDRDSPDPGQGFFYLVEYFDGTESSYGTESALKPRIPGAGECE